MKRTILVLLTILMLMLSACSGQSTVSQVTDVDAYPGQGSIQATETPMAATATQSTADPTATVASTTASVSLDTTYENALSVPLQLLWGTFKLAGTGQAVTKDQATALLPLWSQYKTLSMPSGPGQGGPGQPQDATPTPDGAETDELVQQILAVMTPEQLQAIMEMKITQETAQAIMEEQGISIGGPQQANGAPGGGNPPQGDGAQPPQGTPPADGGPGAGGTPPGGGQPPVKNGQPGAESMPPGGEMVPPGVIDALIELLGEISGDPAAVATAQVGGQTNSPSSGTYTIKAFYAQDGDTQTKTGEAYTAAEEDQSAIYVTNGGQLTLSNATITTTGNTSSQDNSSFYGLNAAVLAESGGIINLSDSTITTSGTGANGAFASGSGSTVALSNVTINATGDGGHGVMATLGGLMTLTNVDMTTAGKNSGAIATDRGSGTINVTGGTVVTTGQDSPAIYSTGVITVTGGTLSASGAEAAVIEGANSIILNDSSLSSSKEKWGVMIYQSMSGDAEGTQGSFTMTGGKLEYTPASGPLFYVTNSTGIITLKGVSLSNGSSVLIKAGAGNWGNSGSNGGAVIFTADGQALTGDLVADNLSTIDLALQNGSTLEGAINTENTAKSVRLTLDASSTWNVTADSSLTVLTLNGGISGTNISSITGNGHTVYYDASACPDLNGQTYTLSGGGYLKPSS